MNPTPNGPDGQEDNKNNNNETPGGIEYSSFEPVQGYANKLGPIPHPLNDIERLKLRLGLKIGLFYYQYTILLKSLSTNVLHAHRGDKPRNPH